MGDTPLPLSNSPPLSLLFSPKYPYFFSFLNLVSKCSDTCLPNLFLLSLKEKTLGSQAKKGQLDEHTKFLLAIEYGYN